MISVIIPAYNQAQYLEECVESVLHQTRSPAEVIIVNDGSTDNTLQIARKFEGSHKGKDGNYFRIKVIDQVNKGLPGARNAGIMNATGNYVLPLDSDDILLENCLEEVYQKIQETRADIIGLSFREFGIRNTEIILMSQPTIQEFKYANRIGYCSAIKKSVLLECGGYSPKMVWGYEDFHLWFDLLSRGKKLVVIQKVLWLYRTKEKSMINDSIAHHQELMGQIAKDFPVIFPEAVEIKSPLPK